MATPGQFSFSGFSITPNSAYGGTDVGIYYNYAGGQGYFSAGTGYAGNSALGQSKIDFYSDQSWGYYQGFNEGDLNTIYSKLGELGFDAFSSYYTPPTTEPAAEIPNVPPAFNPGPSETPATVTNNSPSTNPTSPTQSSSVGTENLAGNGTFSGSGNIFAGNQALGWASFASQVQGNRLFNEAQSQLQDLINSTGQGNAGQIVDSLMSGIQTGAAALGSNLQVSERYDMQKVRNGRKKIGYEQTKTFEQGSQAAQLGRPTLLGG